MFIHGEARVVVANEVTALLLHRLQERHGFRCTVRQCLLLFCAHRSVSLAGQHAALKGRLRESSVRTKRALAMLADRLHHRLHDRSGGATATHVR